MKPIEVIRVIKKEFVKVLICCYFPKILFLNTKHENQAFQTRKIFCKT
jgi:hypothetical protein